MKQAYGRIIPRENEMLTHVGPGTPMGELLRRYWQPIDLSAVDDAGHADVPAQEHRAVDVPGEERLQWLLVAGPEDACRHRVQS